MKLRLLTTVLVPLAVLGSMSLPSGAAAPNPYSQMKLIMAEADSQRSVHFSDSSTISGVTFHQVTDAGRTIGRQVNTLTSGGVSNSVLIELIDGTLYVKGDNTILKTYMGFPTATANQLANKWFTIAKTNSDYANVALGLTVASAMTELTMTSAVTTAPSTTLAGVKVQALSGVTVKTALEPSFSEVLYYSESKHPLPVEAKQSYKTQSGSVRFGDWNKSITLARPNAALQLS